MPVGRLSTVTVTWHRKAWSEKRNVNAFHFQRRCWIACGKLKIHKWCVFTHAHIYVYLHKGRVKWDVYLGTQVFWFVQLQIYCLKWASAFRYCMKVYIYIFIYIQFDTCGLLPSSFSVDPPNLVVTPQSESVLTSQTVSIFGNRVSPEGFWSRFDLVFPPTHPW